MKVNHTFDLSDKARLAVGIAASGDFRNATRDEVRAFLDITVAEALAGPVKELEAFVADVTAKVKSKK